MARRVRRVSLALALCIGLSSLAPTAGADEYDPERAGHPLRIAAYALHPFGVMVDYLILRPAHWLGHREPFSTIFGHEHGSQH